MALWGSKDQANNAPKYTVSAGTNANGSVLFGSTPTGVFGVDTTEAGITTGDGKKVAHAGWNVRKAGTGPVTGFTITDGGTGYSNGFLTLTSTNGSGANASYTVNSATGAINSITLVSGGSGYDVAPTADGDAGGAESATITVSLGGRAGRVNIETLVAMGSMSGDAEDTIFPNS